MNWKNLSRKVRERDKNTCQRCGAPALDIHHIIPRKDSKSSDNMSNLICLCNSCHKTLDNFYTRYGITRYCLKMINEARKRSLK